MSVPLRQAVRRYLHPCQIVALLHFLEVCVDVINLCVWWDACIEIVLVPLWISGLDIVCNSNQALLRCSLILPSFLL